MADWFEGYRTLPPLVDRADVIVRATAVSATTSSEMWGVGYRTTLRVERVLKAAPGSTLTVLESACPVLHGGPKDWLLFLSPKPDDPSVFQVPGGIQGAFPVAAGRIAPVYSDASLVRMYTGVDAAELEREISAIAPIDGDAAARLRSAGWTVAAKRSVQAYELTHAQDFGETRLPPRYERPFEGYARVAQVAGHPVLSELLSRIMRQEGRHIDFYSGQAKRRLRDSAVARRVTRAALDRLWKPVGSDVMPPAEVEHLRTQCRCHRRSRRGQLRGRLVLPEPNRRAHTIGVAEKPSCIQYVEHAVQGIGAESAKESLNLDLFARCQ